MQTKKPAKSGAKSKAAPKSAAAEVAAYLAKAAPDQRAALQKLLKQIKQSCPDAVEVKAYGVVGFKYKGRPLIYLGYAKDHCALYGAVMPAFAKELKGFDTSKGTIRFTHDKPIPATLVKKMVMARMAEIEAKLKK